MRLDRRLIVSHLRDFGEQALVCLESRCQREIRLYRSENYPRPRTCTKKKKKIKEIKKKKTCKGEIAFLYPGGGLQLVSSRCKKSTCCFSALVQVIKRWDQGKPTCCSCNAFSLSVDRYVGLSTALNCCSTCIICCLNCCIS